MKYLICFLLGFIFGAIECATGNQKVYKPVYLFACKLSFVDAVNGFDAFYEFTGT